MMLTVFNVYQSTCIGIFLMSLTSCMHICLKDIEDIDFKSANHSLSAKWTGFYHAYVEITYQFRAGTSPGAADVVQNKDVGKNESYTDNGLSLSFFTVQLLQCSDMLNNRKTSLKRSDNLYFTFFIFYILSC